MNVINSNYYILKNKDGTYAIWTTDDMYKMSNNIRTYEEALKILSIMPHSIIKEK